MIGPVVFALYTDISVCLCFFQGNVFKEIETAFSLGLGWLITFCFDTGGNINHAHVKGFGFLNIFTSVNFPALLDFCYYAEFKSFNHHMLDQFCVSVRFERTQMLCTDDKYYCYYSLHIKVSKQQNCNFYRHQISRNVSYWNEVGQNTFIYLSVICRVYDWYYLFWLSIDNVCYRILIFDFKQSFKS